VNPTTNERSNGGDMQACASRPRPDELVPGAPK